MNRKNAPYYFLIVSSITGLVLLPFAIVKRSFKDWVIVYLVSVLGNTFADKLLVSKGFLRYKKKFLNQFAIHFPFDFIHYPLMLLYYNQWTLNSRPIGIILKVLPIAIPQILVETFAAKKSNLITWKKGWTWYHSLISVILKMWVCRSIIALIRTINNGKISV